MREQVALLVPPRVLDAHTLRSLVKYERKNYE